MKNTRKLYCGIAVLIAISPLGLILPEAFQSGPAWGEWGAEEIEKMLGFVPEGFKRISDLWPAPLPDYNLKTWEGQGLAKSGLAYVFSGVLGVGAVILVSIFLGKIFVRNDKA